MAVSPSHRRALIAVVVLLTTHGALLTYSATCHSPTQLEPAFLASGVSHWQLGRFDLFCVNPPLPRMIAALPAISLGCKSDWSHFIGPPAKRTEFAVGEDFIAANGESSIPLIIYARWAGVPLNLLGAFFAYRWARELYGDGAGLISLTLFVFDPNLLAHGELATADGAGVAFGIIASYAFWHWLKRPTFFQAMIAGGALGLAGLSKTTWLILFAVWPLLLMTMLWNRRNSASPDIAVGGDTRSTTVAATRSVLLQFAIIVVNAIYVINLGYAFEGSGARLETFDFVSDTLTSPGQDGIRHNRFVATSLGKLPLPLPKQYVLGVDRQKHDFEIFNQLSYLRGSWQERGWWYYYLYGLAVKTPCGTLVLLVIAIVARLARCTKQVSIDDELSLLAPSLAILVLASAQTAFSIHLRYVYPALGPIIIFLSQAYDSRVAAKCFRNTSIIILAIYSTVSCLATYPHHLSYFNDFVGGPKNGHLHLLGSSFDWGQDWLHAAHFAKHSGRHVVPVGLTHPMARALGFEAPPATASPAEIVYVVSRASLAGKNNDGYSGFISEPYALNGFCLLAGRWKQSVVAAPSKEDIRPSISVAR